MTKVKAARAPDFHSRWAAFVVGTSALAFAYPAQAQVETGAAATPTPERGTESAAAVRTDAAAPVAGPGLEEIVVTAQRRSESLQKVPIAIEALSEARIAAGRVDGLVSLQFRVPGLVLNEKNYSAVPFIRGVGNPSSVLSDEKSVALYLDGIYLPNSAATLLNFKGIQRIEILKGPQGTLFGRNALGGAIQIVTKLPQQTPEAVVTLGYGNYDTPEGGFYVTGGLASNLAADIEVYARKQYDGWGRNVFLGNETYLGWDATGRASVLWNIADSTRVRVSGLYAALRKSGGATAGVAPGYIGNDQITRFISRFKIASPYDTYSKVRSHNISARLDHDLNWAQFVSLTSYNHSRGQSATNQAGVQGSALQLAATATQPASRAQVPIVTQTQSTVTQEFQLLSPVASKINWIIGVFYLHADDHSVVRTRSFPVAPSNGTDFAQKANSYAAFVQVTAPIIGRLSATLGARYTKDSKEAQIRAFAVATGVTTGTQTNENQYKSPTYRAVLSYQATDDILTYISYNTGFKSGIYNVTSVTNPPVAPEQIKVYEAGFKSLVS